MQTVHVVIYLNHIYNYIHTYIYIYIYIYTDKLFNNVKVVSVQGNSVVLYTVVQ